MSSIDNNNNCIVFVAFKIDMSLKHSIVSFTCCSIMAISFHCFAFSLEQLDIPPPKKKSHVNEIPPKIVSLLTSWKYVPPEECEVTISQIIQFICSYL